MIYWNEEKTQEILEQTLSDQQVILASGDTVLGLWGTITESVFHKLNTIKQRHDKPYLLVIGSAEKLPLFTDQQLTSQLKTLIETCWPGPVTIIVKARSDLPSWMKSPDGTIALRVPDHNGLLRLLTKYDALFSTSANTHGQPIPESVGAVNRLILSQVGAVCVERGQLVYPQSPSTILNCSSGTIEVVRSGAFHVDMIRDLLG
ncbi:Sua5/YciO/YrdC/YwlC family protein [Candidatus Babeliales bacterium]|nr:Sua5/YciO/YrdC/YwlC family protein [Candidatus Babeliales bacterium]